VTTSLSRVVAVDLYRLKQGQDISFLGLDKLFPEGVGLVEWPSPALDPYIPPDYLEVTTHLPILASLLQDLFRFRV